MTTNGDTDITRGRRHKDRDGENHGSSRARRCTLTCAVGSGDEVRDRHRGSDGRLHRAARAGFEQHDVGRHSTSATNSSVEPRHVERAQRPFRTRIHQAGTYTARLTGNRCQRRDRPRIQSGTGQLLSRPRCQRHGNLRHALSPRQRRCPRLRRSTRGRWGDDQPTPRRRPTAPRIHTRRPARTTMTRDGDARRRRTVTGQHARSSCRRRLRKTMRSSTPRPIAATPWPPCWWP